MSHTYGYVLSRVPSFLELPAEIRNKIYGYICYTAAPIRLYFHQDPQSDKPKPVAPFALDTTIPIAFFLTCRQLNAEASSTFYSENIFLLTRSRRFASLMKPCFVSALVRFFDVLGSRSALVRKVVFDTFNLYNSVFLRPWIGKTNTLTEPINNDLEVIALIRHAWDRGLKFEINLIDVADVKEDRAEYWMRNPVLTHTTAVVATINSLLHGQLNLLQHRNWVHNITIKRDGSGGFTVFAGDPYNVRPTNPLPFYLNTRLQFKAKDGGKQLVFSSCTLL